MKYLILSSAGNEGNDNSLNWEVSQSTPVPEPSAFGLLSLIAVALVRRRKRMVWGTAKDAKLNPGLA
jgi:hypothetical protein